MQHFFFSDGKPTFKIAILIKDSSFNKNQMIQAYGAYLTSKGIDLNDVFAISLPYNNNKAKAELVKDTFTLLIPQLEKLGTEFIYCADSTYFKALCKESKAEPHLGMLLPVKFKESPLKAFYGINHTSVLYDPKNEAKMKLSLDGLIQAVKGGDSVIASEVIKSAHYPMMYTDIQAALNGLLIYPELVVDIEAFSLQIKSCGIGSVAFATDKHTGVAFLVDYKPIEQEGAYFGIQVNNKPIKKLLRQFFDTYQGKLIAHNGSFDFRVFVYELYMDHPLDYVGMLIGIERYTKLFDDTKLIAYLATNSCAGNELGLKLLAHSFAGNYAVDVKDIRKVKWDDLLKYNLIDCCATWFVYEQYKPKMIADQQEEIYEGLFKASFKVIMQMELVGMPMHDSLIQKAKKELAGIANKQYVILAQSQFVKDTVNVIKQNEVTKANAKLVKLVKTVDDFKSVKFNPNSTQQLAILLHEVMQLPILQTTPTNQPATGMDELKDLINHTTDPKKQEVIQALIDLAKVSKILTDFIPSFENGFLKADGMRYLHGSFNLGGTISGRLSSSSPNMQNLPSGSTYGKLVKSCFVAPKGWVICYADFNSLEDRIDALLTKDPNKLKIYIEGYDSHALRAYNYFPEAYMGIPDTVESINATVVTHKTYRQDSKAPTFALTYGGTYYTLMVQCGFTMQRAKQIVANYDKMYQVSLQYKAKRVKEECAALGYATVAFGLRVRTPVLAKTILNTKQTPYQATQESRSVGNAMGQSYGMLNSRACAAFMEKVWQSEYRHDILCISQIHDASYFLVRSDLNAIKFVNDHLIAEMQWQEDPAIQHDLVGLHGELDVCYTSWATPITIPNNSSILEIKDALVKGAAKYKAA